MNNGLPTSLTELLEVHGRLIKAGIHTGIPAKVVSYDAAKNVVDVEIVVRGAIFDRSGDRTYETLPMIPAVPVIWPRAGGMICRLPLTVGDFMWLSFSEVSLAEWRATGELSEPIDSRRHSIGYPYATPGAFPDTAPLSSVDAAAVASGKAIFGVDGGNQVRVDSSTIEFAPAGVTPISPVALSVPTDANFAALASAITALTAVVATMSTFIGAHVHPVTVVPATGVGATAPPSGTAPPAPPAGPPAPGTTASTLTKSL